MTELLWEIVGGWVRAGLVALSMYLVQHHVVTDTQGERLATMLLARVMVLLPGVAAVAWTTFQKYRSRIRLLTALETPAGASEGQVRETIANGRGATLSGQ